MEYSLVGVLSVIIQIVINYSVFHRDNDSRIPAARYYRMFLISVIAYHFIDAVWGILYEIRMISLLYLWTAAYFAALAISILIWSAFVVNYLHENKRFERISYYVGWILFAFQLAVLTINAFDPILFYFDELGNYQVNSGRYVLLGVQAILYFISSVYVFVESSRSNGGFKRRYKTIGLFGIAMILALTAQELYPLLPLYSIGYLLGCCVLHTFVVEDEKEEYLKELEKAKKGVELKQIELENAQIMMNTDPLTGAFSKFAYIKNEEEIDARISDSSLKEFAVAVFDINNLKDTNDTKGHEAGDNYINSAYSLIREIFTDSPIYRIGGDEFVVILEGKDYENRKSLMESFTAKMENNLYKAQEIVISSGMSEFDQKTDSRYSDVFSRADDSMYLCKWLMKERAYKESLKQNS